ncbi:MAG: DMT family transporter [Rhodobacteraceae bacterium]|jgi:drug/metabolite transporter (DMT)-like permease|nr:DMT family transporter [Paracoccaceae bacterium]
MGWVIATLIAAAAQTARNATQTGLTRAIGTLGATQVRFLFGLPFAILFLAGLRASLREPIPALNVTSLSFTAMGAVAQIAATAVMLLVMQKQGFGLATALLKTEPVIVALIGWAMLGDALTPLMLLAIAMTVVGVLVMSGIKGRLGAAPMLLGLLAGGLFGLSAIGFRGGIVHLETGGFLIRAGTVLVVALTMQTAILLAWMAVFQRAAIAASFRVWRSALLAGFLGAFASQFWFIGFALTSAANVRTLALIEVLMAQGVAISVLRQKSTAQQWVGMAVLLAGVALLLRGA